MKKSHIIHKSKMSFLDKVAVKITNAVGTMYCAIIFAILALISLPQALSGGAFTTVSWISQTFIQLVLLSIIMVGQKLESQHSEIRSDLDYETNVEAKKDIEKVLKEIKEIKKML